MKQDRSQRRTQGGSRRPSSASAILSGKSVAAGQTDYFSFGWLLLIGTFITITLISFLFTPYTHQLDEIKNVLLMLSPPLLLTAAIWKMDFSAITWKRHGALIMLGLYFLWMWVSWLVNPYKLMGERVIWFNLGVSTFAVVFAWYMNTENKFRKTMIFFVMLGLVSTVLGLFLYAGRYTQGFYVSMLHDPDWQTGDRRKWATLAYTLATSSNDMYSFILNSDFYAAFLVMLIPISLSMFFVENRTLYKIMALASFLLMNVCLFLTNSNDSFIAMFAIAYPLYFLIGWFHVKSWGLSRRSVITLGACTLALLTLVAIMMLPKLSATFEFKSAAFEGRRVLWGGGFWPWIYGDNLHGQSVDFISVIFGTGPGGYRHYFPWFRRPDFFDQQINNVTTFSHNFYLDVLLETGLVGLILFIGFNVRVLADGWRQIRTTQNRTHRLYQLGITIGLVGIAVQNYSSPNNRWAVAGMMYWCLFGLSMGLKNIDDPAVPGESVARIGKIPVHRAAWWASMALALLFVWRCVAPGAQFADYWVGATENAEGLEDMQNSDYKGLTPEQKLMFLSSAMDHFKKAIEANPTFATSYYKLGHVYNQIGVMTGEPEYSRLAIKTYEDLDDVNANYSEVHLNLGIMYVQWAGNIAESKQKLIEETTKLKQQLQSATGDEKRQLEEQYGQKMETLKTLEGSEKEIRLKFMEKSYNQMKKAAHQSLKPNTQYMTGTIGRELAMLYEDMNMPKKAAETKEEIKKYFRSIIEYKPRLEDLQKDQKEVYPKAERNLLMLAEETNNMDETISILKLMVHDNPESELMLKALLEAYDRAGKTDDKLAYLEKSIHADPTDAILRRELAEAYKAAGKQKKYINELRRVEILLPKDAAVLKALGKAYLESDTPAKAQAYVAKLNAMGLSLADNPTTGSTEVGTKNATTGTAQAADAPDNKTTGTTEAAMKVIKFAATNKTSGTKLSTGTAKIP